MSLITLIMVFVAVGLVMWLINSFVPMDGNIKKLMNGAVIVLLVLWLISVFFPSVANIRVGH